MKIISSKLDTLLVDLKLIPTNYILLSHLDGCGEFMKLESMWLGTSVKNILFHQMRSMNQQRLHQYLCTSIA
uniref:Uncharacterized protein n=1 Tax=Arion vulgaris TaxID=1028688 RepID=A0A0B7BUM6_9EUPU